jgi:hypothetical protein
MKVGDAEMKVIEDLETSINQKPKPEDVWESNDVGLWESCWNNYELHIQNSAKPDVLIELDEWYYKTFPNVMKEQKYINLDQYIMMIQWKLNRGVYRPSLLKYARAQDESAVQEASACVYTAFKGGDCRSFDNVKVAINMFTKLKGVGVATASVLLSAICPSVPFMSDELLRIVLRQPTKFKYSMPEYKQCYEQATEKAKCLGKSWTASKVERVVFALSI